ncbi:MAG: hypothetical protein MI923_13085 [Phycisphaerales bacterium]|nr:hypothetical protein [Phycisphaerales bacterium]
MQRITRRRCFSTLFAIGLLFIAGGGGGDCQVMQDPDGGPTGTLERVVLNLVKLDVNATTASGPTVGDGVLAFNANANAVLAWLRSGETQARVVPAPANMTHDTQDFMFVGTKLVVKDRNSGSIYVFDTDSEDVQAIPSASVNLGTSGTWDADGHLVATLNATVTTQDGPNQVVKMTDITDINNFVTTPFDDPTEGVNTVSVDATGGRIAVRGNQNSFFIYDVNNPGAPIANWNISPLQGGAGVTGDIKIRGDFVIFFDDDEVFSLLNIVSGVVTKPARNPARANRGLDIEPVNGANRYGYFSQATDDDGNSIAIVNRLLLGRTDDVDNPIDPLGEFVNGGDADDGRVGFGASVSISPNGRFVFVAGAAPVEVSEEERLYLSIDGANFSPVEDTDDALNILRASAVDCSDNLVAFLIPQDLDDPISPVTIGYATLPPP